MMKIQLISGVLPLLDKRENPQHSGMMIFFLFALWKEHQSSTVLGTKGFHGSAVASIDDLLLARSNYGFRE
jgi:hypothetical protein